MYRCTDCEKEFEFVKVVFETHRLDTPPFERQKLCPFCGSSDFIPLINTHCRFCGVKLRDEKEYCSDKCRQAGIKYYELERKNRKLFSESPVAKAVLEVSEYNKTHGTKYSYGKYFSLKEAGKI